MAIKRSQVIIVHNIIYDHALPQVRHYSIINVRIHLIFKMYYAVTIEKQPCNIEIRKLKLISTEWSHSIRDIAEIIAVLISHIPYLITANGSYMYYLAPTCQRKLSSMGFMCIMWCKKATIVSVFTVECDTSWHDDHCTGIHLNDGLWDGITSNQEANSERKLKIINKGLFDMLMM